MTSRKMALVGTAQGPWINIRNMTPLRVKVDMPEGAQVAVFVTEGSSVQDVGRVTLIDTPGEHAIPSGTWAHVYVSKGNPSDVLCAFLCRQVVNAL